ncbi:MAG: hypothetical protein JJE04_08615 [Acidobacteriia bacterium]|nr:hypothetical protein [Terriglobia bacterium]
MTRRDALLSLPLIRTGLGQQAAPQEIPVDFTCPMDKDVRTKGPGMCPRCGMKLVAHLPDPIGYRLLLKTKPNPVQAGKPVELEFQIRHPDTGKPVTEFEVIHEKIFHLFLVSQDLSYFAHEHPVRGENGIFRLTTTLPRPGAYRVVADCFPSGATPQFLVKSLLTGGATAVAWSATSNLAPDLKPQQGANLTVELAMEPAQPIAGQETLLFFRLSTAEGMEQYLGAWGHMLAASDDLIDIIHDHPLYTTLPQIQFNVLFPREAVYRVWVQLQRAGVLNTVAFNVPVKTLR